MGFAEGMWFYSNGSEKAGPVPLAELAAEIAAGRVRSDYLVWREGMDEWKPASEVIEVQQAAAQARVNQMAPVVVTPTMAAAPPHNAMALTSMILGICSIVLMSLLLTGIPAVICGHKARRQIRDSQQPQVGDGMAMAGLILGYLSIIGSIGLGILMGIMYFTVSKSGGMMP